MEQDFIKVFTWYILQSVQYNVREKKLYLAGDTFIKTRPECIYAEAELYDLPEAQIERVIKRLIPNKKLPVPRLERVRSYVPSVNIPWENIQLTTSDSVVYNLLLIRGSQLIGIELKCSDEFPVGHLMELTSGVVKEGGSLQMQIYGQNYSLERISDIRIIRKPEIFTRLDTMCSSGEDLIRYLFLTAPEKDGFFTYSSMSLEPHADSIYILRHRVSAVEFFPIEGKQFSMVDIKDSIRPFCTVDSVASMKEPFRTIRVNSPGLLEWKNDIWQIKKKASINLI